MAWVEGLGMPRGSVRVPVATVSVSTPHIGKCADESRRASRRRVRRVLGQRVTRAPWCSVRMPVATGDVSTPKAARSGAIALRVHVRRVGLRVSRAPRRWA